jgi:hypothetical protein
VAKLGEAILAMAPASPGDYSIAALDAVQAEGDAGTTAFTFTVSRSGDTAAPGSVDWAVSGADVDGADFPGGLPSGTLNFAAGQASQTLTVNVAGDTAFESDEDFTVTLSNASAGSSIITPSAGGTIENDDSAPAGPVVLVDADFNANGDTEGFVYSDGVFGGSAAQASASGSWSGGELLVNLGGGSNTTVLNMSGAWEIDFTLVAEMDVELAFDYQLTFALGYESDEFGQMLVSLDGGTPMLLAEFTGDGNSGPTMTTGEQSAVLDLGTLLAGDHTLSFGGFNNKKTWSDETTQVAIDNVLITGTPTPAGAGTQFAGMDSGLGNPGPSEMELLAGTIS